MCLQESQHTFGIRSGDEFITLSNFTLEYVCEVRAGVDDSGFIVDATLLIWNLYTVVTLNGLRLLCKQ